MTRPTVIDPDEQARLAELREREREPVARRRGPLEQSLRRRGKGWEDHDCLCAFAKAVSSTRLIDFEGAGWRESAMLGLRLGTVHRPTARRTALRRVGRPCCADHFEDWSR